MAITGLTTFEQKLHNLLVRNELGGDSSIAYKISHAGTSKSGFSFGYNQWDMSTSKYKDTEGYVYKLFKKLLTNFPGSASSSKFTEDEIGAILKIVTTVKGDKTALDAYKSRINEALSTQEAKTEIDNQHIASMREDIDRIDSIISGITNADDRAFFETDMAKLFLLDYHNQFNLSLTGPMARYVQTRTYSSTNDVAMRGDSFGIDDLLNAYLHTRYANISGGTPDLINRFSNTFSIAGYSHFSIEEAKGLMRIKNYLTRRFPNSSDTRLLAFDTQFNSAKQILINNFSNNTNIDNVIVGDILGYSNIRLTNDVVHVKNDTINGNEHYNDLIFGEDIEGSEFNF